VWVLLNKVAVAPDKALQLKRLRRREALISTDRLGATMLDSDAESIVNLAREQLDAERLKLPRWKRSTAASRGNQGLFRRGASSLASPREKHGEQGEFQESRQYRAAWATGLLVREGVELDSKLVRNIPDGELFDATARSTNLQGQCRLRLSDGWVSETAGKTLRQPCVVSVNQGNVETLDPGGIHSDTQIDYPVGAITVVHRSRIKEYYGSEQRAKQAGYDPPTSEISSHGRVNPFGGLRWDSRILHNTVRKGEEKRVKTVHSLESPDAARCSLEEADVVINATGFEAEGSQMWLYSEESLGDGKRLQQDGSGAIVVNENGAVQTEDGSTVPNLFSIGLGSGYACNMVGVDGEKGSEGQRVPKSDGVDLYVSLFSKLILDQTVGPSIVTAKPLLL